MARPLGERNLAKHWGRREKPPPPIRRTGAKIEAPGSLDELRAILSGTWEPARK